MLGFAKPYAGICCIFSCLDKVAVSIDQGNTSQLLAKRSIAMAREELQIKFVLQVGQQSHALFLWGNKVLGHAQ